jgi:hypothetical protein
VRPAQVLFAVVECMVCLLDNVTTARIRLRHAMFALKPQQWKESKFATGVRSAVSAPS